jgi:hypothetical protein
MGGSVEKKNFYFASVRAGGSPVVVSSQSSRIVSVTRTAMGVYDVLLQEGLSASDYIGQLTCTGQAGKALFASLFDTTDLTKTISVFDSVAAGAPADGEFNFLMALSGKSS